MTASRLPQDGDAPAAALAPKVLATLLDHGRWSDAADYLPHVEGPAPGARAAILLAAGRDDEAGVILASVATDDDDLEMSFLRSAEAVLSGDGLRFPRIVAMTSQMAAGPLTDLVMMRAAQAAGQVRVAAHYATRVLSAAPHVEASTVLALDHVGRAAYVDAVRVIDRADRWRCDDEASALHRTMSALGMQKAALVATWTLRRCIRRDGTTLDPATCRCLALWRLHGEEARRYVDVHLFPAGAVPGRPGWQLSQCLHTYAYFLGLPDAGLTVALSPHPPLPV